jgi:hypothetical protein
LEVNPYRKRAPEVRRINMRTKQSSIRLLEDITQSWGETQIIEVIRDAYASHRSPEQLIRERSLRRGSSSASLTPGKSSVTEKLSMVTVYQRKDGFLRGLWRGLVGK